MKLKVLAPLALVVLLAGCVTQIRPTVTYNPPPSRALNEFHAFEVARLAADAGVEERAAMAKIQQNLDQKLGALTAQWTRGAADRTLVIEPRVHELKFVGGGGRFLAGAMAGSSAVRMTLKLTTRRPAK